MPNSPESSVTLRADRLSSRKIFAQPFPFTFIYSVGQHQEKEMIQIV